MAADFSIVSATRVEELRGTSSLVPVWVIEFVTHPHEVDAVLRIPEALVQANITAPPTAFLGVTSIQVQEAIQAVLPDTVAPYATQLEAIASDPNVAAVGFIQDPNAAGQLIDRIRVYVGAGAGAASTWFDVPMLNITYGAVAPLIDEAAASLQAMLAT